MSYSDDIHTMADLCRLDPAFLMGIADALRKSGLGEMCGWTPPPIAVEGPPPPFPLPRDITAIQTSLFDNWPSGRPVKGVPSRYGLAMEVWTQEPDKIVIQKGRKPNFMFKAQMALMDSANLKRQVADIRRKKRRTPLDPEYLDALDQLGDAIEGNAMRVGLINTAINDDKSGYDRGRYYHANQFVLVEMEGNEVISAKAIFGTGDDDTIDLAPFADKDAGGNAFARNVVSQSRHASCDMVQSSWATNLV